MNNPEKAAFIVRDAGGEIVGRTRLQKIAYLLELVGLGEGFQFEYRHYGPYSEELAESIRMARAFGLITEEERPTDWGGFYSIYNATNEVAEKIEGHSSLFAERAAQISAIELELAATAAFLSIIKNTDDPWAETERLKPEKSADGRLEKAKASYRNLMDIITPTPLPPIA